MRQEILNGRTHFRREDFHSITIEVDVIAVKFGTAVAYPWYALVGSGTVVAVGILASLVLPEGERAAKPAGVAAE